MTVVIQVSVWVGVWVETVAMGALTDRRAKTAGPGRHGDSAVKGLMLVVQPGGSRSWLLRYQMAGKRHDMGLGSYPEIGLSRAREKAMGARRLIAEGRDPIAARVPILSLTFKAAAEALIESKRAGWRNVKHAAQWGSTLEACAYPKLGGMDVKAIDTTHVLEVLQPIWAAKPETASRVRQRIEAVLTTPRPRAPGPTSTRRAGAATSRTFSPSPRA